MKKFTDAIKLHKNGTLIKNIGTNLFTVNSAFSWYLDYGKKGYKIEVEKGFISNFGSIPRILWIFFNPTKYIIYLAHDKIYEHPIVWTDLGNGVLKSRVLTRKECDLVLLEGLRIEGAGKLERICIYLGVRLGGWLFFKK